MKQLNNTYKDGYYLCEDGRIYDSAMDCYIEADSQHCFTLLTADNQRRRVSIKVLYREVYDREYCIDNTDNLDNEHWTEVIDTHGKYLVSDKGRVKSCQHYYAKILKPYTNKGGYMRVDININGIRTSSVVHRLVAAAYLPMPQRIDMQIHHKDFNTHNNAAANLMWVTPREHAKIHKERKKKDVSTKPEKDIH